MALFDNDSAEMQNLGLVKKLAHNEKHERDEAVETLNTFLCGKRAEEYEDEEAFLNGEEHGEEEHDEEEHGEEGSPEETQA